ncbi:MAG: hypothetical protein L3V56_05695 [Candidatus Magnetoovum sp. WYHC-5]|nr:hypothetical protein [Candidatus Magnetoovum sp. WYHC-5]
MLNLEYTLPIAPNFDPKKVASVWRVHYQEIAKEARLWANSYAIKPSSNDKVRICLLLIDVQNTFCLPDFELFVAGKSGTGAIDDNVRLCEFIYRYLAIITEIIPTMDTHMPIQIFNEIFWINNNGEHPTPMTVISTDDVKNGIWQVNPVISNNNKNVQQYAMHYVTQLEQGGKYPLIIWPYHAMLGGIGHALVASIEEAIFFHSIARQCHGGIEMKGTNPLTEHYSALRPDILNDAEGIPIAQKNYSFIEKLLSFDALIIAGQAKSHCVAWTVDDLIGEIMAKKPQLLPNVYILEDCTSPVVVPGVVDFTEVADDTFRRFAATGVNIVKSTDTRIFSDLTYKKRA